VLAGEATALVSVLKPVQTVRSLSHSSRASVRLAVLALSCRMSPESCVMIAAARAAYSQPRAFIAGDQIARSGAPRLANRS